jgi:hypothetical protein
MSRFASTVVTSVGSHGLMASREAANRPPSLHVSGSNSFNLVIRGTNLFNYSSNVGSNWVDVSSPVTAPGMYHFPEFSYGATVIQVNSVAGTLVLAVG